MPRKSNCSASPSTLRRSARIKRDELKAEQITSEEQAFSEKKEETQQNKSLPKKRVKPIVSNNRLTKKPRNEDEQTEVESPNNGNQEQDFLNKDTLSISKDKGKSKAVEQPNDSTVITAPSEINPLVQAKWELIKQQLFEVPKKPCPAYSQYQEKLFIKRPWMEMEDVKFLQYLYTNPNSIIAQKKLKTLFNHKVYNNFSNEQKSHLLPFLLKCELVPIANDDGDPIDSPSMENEHVVAGLGQVSGLDPDKVCPRFDFWQSDHFKDAIWWFKTSISCGYNTAYGIELQWKIFEKFRTEVPKNWKNDDYEQAWGIGLSEKMGKKQIAGNSALISLPEMAKAQIIRLNDMLRYKRQFMNVGITVLMDLRVIAIESNGHLRVELFKGAQTKILYDVHNPTRLETDLLDFDGRVDKSSRPNGNAYKNFSILRSDNYTPSLFEARKEYWVKTQ